MGRAFLAAVGIAAWIGVAEAAPPRKVAVESDPPGASVYLDTEEDGELCKTPCTITVPATAETIIVELAGHKRLFEPLKLPAKVTAKPFKVSYKLEPAIATIVLDSPAGATITVDDEDKGKVPARVDVDAGAHHLVVALGGKKLYDQFVNVEVGDELAVPIKAVATAEHEPPATDHDPGEENGTKVSVSKPLTVSHPHDTYLSLAARFDVGFRSFHYDNNATPATLREESERGQVLGGPLVEIYPGAIAGVHALRGLAAVLRFQLGLNSESVTNTTNLTTTFWRSFEISLRQRWSIGELVTLEVGGGFVRDQFEFNGVDSDIALVPDVDYQSVRIGGRASVRLGPIEPYATIENRVVLTSGDVGTRFKGGSSTNGVHAAAGLLAHFGPFTAQVEGAITDYSWTFKTLSTMDMYQATGGSDSISQLGFSLGYAY